MTNNKNKPARGTPIIEPLSDRVLFSADPLGLSDSLQPWGSDAADSLLGPMPEMISIAANAPLADSTDHLRSTELVFIDTTVSDYQQIIDALSQDLPQTDFIIHTLDSSQSIEHVDAVLADHTGLAGIHFITHGTDDTVRLGTTSLNSASLTAHQSSLQTWWEALSNEGDILFYGCNFAATEDGQALVNAIAAATQADVAASDDWTGHESLNADWQLEYATGPIESNSQHIADSLVHWESVLAAITVDTFNDLVDAPDLSSVDALLDSTRGPGPDGQISLREAVIAANAEPDADVIYLSSGTYKLDAPLNSNLPDEYYGDLNIANSLTIIGTGTDAATGTVIDGEYRDRAPEDRDRVMSIYQADSVSLQSLTLTGGEASDSGGALHAFETQLTLESVNVVHNQAADGAGIYLDNLTAYLSNLKIESNNASNQGGGVNINHSIVYGYQLDINNNNATNAAFTGQGGGVFNNGLFYLDSSVVDSNYSELGGGLYANGELRVSNTTVQDNTAKFDGGGLYTVGSSYINQSLIAHNKADGGAGILNKAFTQLEDTTVAHNTATSFGGAVKSIAGDTQIYRSTIADNSAQSPGAALHVDPGANIGIQGTLIARNGGTDSIHQNVASKGFNLTDSTIANFHSSDQHLTNPGLDTSLADNGGQVHTYKLLPDSKAINAGTLAGNDSEQQTVDATGAARNGATDIGAYEFRQSSPQVELWYGDYNGDAIHRINVDTGVNQKILDTHIYPPVNSNTGHDPAITYPVKIAIDTGKGRLFWIENDSYGNRDGFTGNLNTHTFGTVESASNPVNLANGFKHPFGLALDSNNERLFLTENLTPDNAPNQNKIQEYSTDGTFIKDTVVDGSSNSVPPEVPLAFISDLEHDASTGTLYWSDTGSADITNAPRDSDAGIKSINQAGDVTAHITNKAPLDTSLGPNGTMYWVDGDEVFHSDTDGTILSNPDITTISNVPETEFKNPFAIEYVAETDKVYVAEWGGAGQSRIWELSSNLRTATVVDENLIAPVSLDSNTLTVVNNGPAVSANLGLILESNNTATISFSNLMAVDPDTPAAQIVFNVSTLPVNGELKIDGVPVTESNNTFTQADIAAGNISYSNFGTKGPDNFSFYVSDENYIGQTKVFNIDVTGINDAPVLDASLTSFINAIAKNNTNAPGTSISDLLNSAGADLITDADPDALEGIAIIEADETNGVWQFKANPADTDWSPVTSASTGVVWDQNALLLSPESLIRFVPNTDFIGQATIDFRAHDWTPAPGQPAGTHFDIQSTGFAGSSPNSAAVGTAVINVLNPQLKLSSIELADVQHLENNPTGITGNLSITRTDATVLQSATVVISSGLNSDEDQLLFSNTGDITGHYNRFTGVLTLTGAASHADYQDALHSVQYNNTSDVPQTHTRTVTFTVNSDTEISNPLSRDISVIPVNDRPEISNLNTNPTYFPSTGPVFLDTSTIVRDAELDSLNDGAGNYSGATLTIGRSDPDDRFYFGSTPIDSSTNAIVIDGSVVAGFVLDNGNLYIRFTDTHGLKPSTDLVTNLIRQIAFSNDDSTDSSIIDLRIRLSDGNTDNTQGLGGIRADTDPVRLTISNPPSLTVSAPVSVETDEDVPYAFALPDQFFIDHGNTPDYPQRAILQATNGVLTVLNAGNAVVTQSNANSFLTIEGLRSDINTALASLVYTPNPDYNSNGGTADLINIWVNANATQQGLYLFSDNKATDTNSNTSHHGTFINDAVVTTAASGERYLTLDGDGDAVSIPTDFGISNSFTVTARVKISLPNSVTDEMTIISIGDSIALTLSTENNQLTGSYKASPGDYRQTIATDVNLATNRWHTVTYTADTLAGRQALYVDGTLVQESTYTADLALNDPATTTMLGASPGISPGGFNGNIDNVQIYSSALSKEVIEGNLTRAFSDTGSVNVIVRPVNDSPLLDLNTNDSTTLDFHALFIENNDPVSIAGNTAINDIDNTRIENLTAQISNLQNSTHESLTASIPAGWSQSYDVFTGTLTILPDNSATPTTPPTHENWSQIVESIKYNNTSDNPDPAQRAITIKVSDGADTNIPIARSIIDIQPVNDAPALTSNNSASATYIENSAPLIISATQSINDVDNVFIQSATVFISNNFIPGEDVLLFTNQSNISGTYNSENGVLNLNGSATIADYEAAINSVKYWNTGDNPGTATRTVEYHITDGQTNSNTITREIEVIGVNDAPTASDSVATAKEDISEEIPFSAFGFSDANNENHDLMMVNVDTSDPRLQVDATNRTVTYTPPANFHGVDTFAYTVTDNGGTAHGGKDTSSSATMSVNVTSINDAPTLSTIEAAPAFYVENSAPVAITGNLKITDEDHNDLHSATISITNNYVASEDTLITDTQLLNSLGINASFDAANGILTLNGASSVANYQTAIHSIGYQNNSNNPSTLARTLSVSVYDGIDNSNVLHRDVEIIAANDAPHLTTIENSAAHYFENNQPIGVTNILQVADLDDASLESATISITENLAAFEDELVADNTMLAHYGITSAFDPTTGTLTLSGTSTVENYQSAIRSIAFTSNSNNPSELDRTISISVNDGDTNSNISNRTIKVTAVNDAPVTDSSSSVKTNEDTAVNIPFSEFVFSDANDANHDLMSVNVDTSDPRLEINTAAETVTYTPPENFNGVDIFEFTVSDNGGTAYGGTDTSLPATMHVNVVSINDLPRLSTIEVAPAFYLENSAPVAITGNLNIADADHLNLQSATIRIVNNHIASEDVLTVDDQLLASLGIGTSFDTASGTLTLSGESSVANYQTAIHKIGYQNNSDNPSDLLRTISVVVNDGINDSNSLSRDISVVAINDAPTALDSLAVTEEDTPVLILFSDFGFSDIDNNDLEKVNIDITDPRLSIDISAKTVTFTPPTNFHGDDTFEFTVTDDHGTPSATSTTALMTVTVKPVNDSPATSNTNLPTILEDSTPAGQLISPLVSPIFSDSDRGSYLSGITIIADAENQDNGQWQYALAGGAWQPVTTPGNTLSETDALLLDVNTSIRFLPATNYHGEPTPLQYKAIDDSYIGGFSTATQMVTTNAQTLPSNSPFSNIAAIGLVVNAVNDAPVISDALLAPIAEDTQLTTPPTIGELFDPDYTDSDGTTNVFGIVVTNNSPGAAEGIWQFSPDGTSWLNIHTTNETDALVLGSNTQLRFSPAADFHGSPAPLELRALDGDYSGTVSTSGERVVIDATTLGTLVSSPQTLSTTIVPVNDSPTASHATLPAVAEDSVNPTGTSVGSLISAGFIDVDAILDPTHGLGGIAITANPEPSENGAWQYLDTDDNWVNVGRVSSSNALLLDANTDLRFLPQANYNGTPTPLLAHAVDTSFTGQYTTATASYLDTQSPDTKSPLSNSIEIQTRVVAINDAPVIGDAVLANQLEDTDTLSPMKVTDLFATHYFDVDGTSEIAGIAITGNPVLATEGTWQYSINNVNWYNINIVSESQSLVLSNESYVRFSPATDFHGAPADLKLRAIDGTYSGDYSDSNKDRVLLDTTISSSMISDERTVSINVLPVNDPPAGTNNFVTTLEDTQYIFNAAEFGFHDPVESHEFSGLTIKSLPVSGKLLLAGNAVETDMLISIVDINSGSFVYLPATNTNTQDNFTFSVIDSGGITNNGQNQDQSANTITIDTTQVNDPPTGNDNAFEIVEGTTNILNSSIFGFTDSVDNHAFSSIVIEKPSAIGSLQLNGTTITEQQVISIDDINSAALVYTAPSSSNLSQDTIIFKVVDDGGTDNGGQNIADSSNTISVAITPQPNTPPSSTDNVVSIIEDSVHAFSASDFTFSDPIDGDNFSAVSIVELPSIGTLTLNDTPVIAGATIPAEELSNLKYLPAPSGSGLSYSSFAFKVIDDGTLVGGGSSISQDSNTLFFDIAAVNDAPFGSDNTLSTTESEPFRFAPADFGFIDPIDQNDFKAVLINSLPASGSLTLNQIPVAQGDTVDIVDIESGSLSYNPAPLTLANLAQFTFHVIDDGGISNGGVEVSTNPNTMTINITTDNHPPSGANKTIQINEDSRLVLSASMFGFSDPIDQHELAGVLISEQPLNGTLLLDGETVSSDRWIDTASLNAQKLEFLPSPNQHGPGYAKIEFRVVDTGNTNSGKHISTPAILTIDVLPINDAPTNLALTTPLELTENSVAESIATASFDDIDTNDTHQYSVDDSRFEFVNNTLSLKPGEAINFENEQSIPLKVTVTDNSGASAVEDIVIQVVNVNEAPAPTTTLKDAHAAAPFSFKLPDDLFTDVDGDDLSLSAHLTDGSPLPEWLLFDTLTGTFTVLENADSETINVTVTATDPGGLTSSIPLNVSVEPKLDTAQLSLPLPQPVYATPVVTSTPEKLTDEDANTEIKENTTENSTTTEEETEEQEAQSTDAELFEATALSPTNEIAAEQGHKEVIQLSSYPKPNQKTLLSHDNNVVVLHEDVHSLFTTINSEAERASAQAAYDAATLQNLAEHVNDRRDELVNTLNFNTQAVATSVTLTSGFTAGYILWLLRGGMLLTSVMASMPAWRTIDPLPVLESLDNDNNDDTESLESMVKESDSADSSDHNKKSET